MKITAITSQHRRDIYFNEECEHCGHKQEGSGYDDHYFHNKVQPNKKCPKCGETTLSKPLDTIHVVMPKYSQDQVV